MAAVKIMKQKWHRNRGASKRARGDKIKVVSRYENHQSACDVARPGGCVARPSPGTETKNKATAWAH